MNFKVHSFRHADVILNEPEFEEQFSEVVHAIDSVSDNNLIERHRSYGLIKDDISIEVGFNHSSVIAWNMIKPVLASELNHVQKAIQTKIGIIITATNAMKTAGGFDGAIGTYEKYLDYLPPLRSLLTTPLLIIGLEPPTSFRIEQLQLAPRKKIGRIINI